MFAFWPLLVSVVMCPLLTLVTSVIEVFIWEKRDLVSRFGQGLGGFPPDLSVQVRVYGPKDGHLTRGVRDLP